MAMTLPTAEDLFEETVRKVSSTPQEWLKFLNTASRVYQYTFDAQLMIYAQRPNAIGCTSFEKWKQMNHYVKRGTQGIALIVRSMIKTAGRCPVRSLRNPIALLR